MADKKNKVIAYVRVSTDDQDAEKQIGQINEYAARNGLHIPKENIIAISMSSRRSTKDRRIEELKERLQPGDTLIATEMSRVGRSVFEVLEIIEKFLIPNKISFYFLRDNIFVHLGKIDPQTKLILIVMNAIYENERAMISLRTKDALAVLKARGVQLGKPKGQVQHSRLDPHVDKIKELLAAKIGFSGIARILECSRTNIIKYLERRPQIQREVNAMLAAKEKVKKEKTNIPV